MPEQVVFRTAKASIPVDLDDAKELRRVVDQFSTGAAEAIDAAIASGKPVVFTHGQKSQVYDVVRFWTNEGEAIGSRLLDLQRALADDVNPP